MTDNPPPRQGGDTDHLWIIGIIGVLGYAACQAIAVPVAHFAAARGLLWMDDIGHWHAEPLTWLTTGVTAAAIVGAAAVAGWARAARRWRRSQLGAIPRLPAVAVGLCVTGCIWLSALATVGTSAVGRGIAVSAALAVGGGSWAWACRYRTRALAVMVFAATATGQLGFGEPGLARVQVGRWGAGGPGLIRATTGPGWRATSSEYAALDRAVAEAGWTAAYQWRSVTAARAVIGEIVQ